MLFNLTKHFKIMKQSQGKRPMYYIALNYTLYKVVAMQQTIIYNNMHLHNECMLLHYVIQRESKYIPS